jgi:hypothetical protein
VAVSGIAALADKVMNSSSKPSCNNALSRVVHTDGKQGIAPDAELHLRAAAYCKMGFHTPACCMGAIQRSDAFASLSGFHPGTCITRGRSDREVSAAGQQAAACL